MGWLDPKMQRATIYSPNPGWWKLNTNGSALGNPGPSGTGGMLKDYEGWEINAFLESVGRENSSGVEILAIKEGMPVKSHLGLWIPILGL